jgi:hypothetical protein
LEKSRGGWLGEREEAADWEVGFYWAFIPRSKEATQTFCFYDADEQFLL